MGVVIDARERVEDQRGTALVGDQAEIEPMHVAQPERLHDRERAVPELRLGREKLDRDLARCQAAQREQSLERCHASAGDYDAKRRAASVHWCRVHGSSLARSPNCRPFRAVRHRLYARPRLPSSRDVLAGFCVGATSS
jgi:hypothetical protein